MMPSADLFDPLALAIVGGGTLAGVALRTPARDLARAVAALRTLGRRPFDAEPLLAQLKVQARIARGHGVLALDRAIITDPDLAAGIAGIVDGADGDTIASLAADRRAARIERHCAAAEVWSGAAELAPAMGMVGTLVGLARMFATMTDPAAIGAGMAVALLATLYGALFANLVFQPIASRMRAAARIEAFERTRIAAPLAALATREAPRALRSVA